ncbi:MAG: metallophosphoesterase [Actinobacteria bacterium]|nr:metallophosphoesterase [Actinomycetota bacterium]
MIAGRSNIMLFPVAALILTVLFLLTAAAPASAVTAMNVAISDVASTEAVLVVKADVTADVTVDYGQSTGVYTATATSNGATRHELTLSGLNPSSVVYYRVTIYDSSDHGVSITITEKSFHTSRAAGEPFSFSAAGDNRPTSDTAVQPAMWNTILGQMAGESLDLSLHVGDIIFGTSSDSLAQNVAKYDGLFAVTAQLTYSTPMYVAAGNHERLYAASSRAGYEQEFTFPVNNGADSGTYGEHYYSFDNGDTHFIALSTELPGQEGLITGNQKAWLEQDLAASSKPWTVVFMHRPLFSGQHGGDPWVNTGNATGQQNKADIHALFLQSGVDVVLEGHDHYYLRHVEDGIQYIITGGGGCSLSGVPALGPGDVFASSSYEHVKVDETSTSLGFDVINSAGATLESFSVAIPDLSLTLGNAYWESYADYLSRSLSVDYTLTNSGAGDASSLQVLSLSASQGVTPLTATPFSLPDVAAGATGTMTVSYQLPQGVEAFAATATASCTDDRGFTYQYPGSDL